MERLFFMEDAVPKVVVAYTADSWLHALCSLRLVEPLRAAGLQLLRGNDPSLGTSDPDLVSQADLVVIQRDFPRFLQAYDLVIKKARDEGKPVVYEIDDYLLELPQEHPDRTIHLYTPAIFPMLRAAIEADLITTSTPALASYFRSFNPNVVVLPNSLVDRYWSFRDPLKKPYNAPVVIGYLGSTTHLPDLEEVVPALQQLIQKYGSSIQLKFWGLKPPADLKALPNVSWAEFMIPDYEKFSTYCSSLDCDIFIAPLKDSFFNSCKSPIKYLEYAAMGIPGVFGRVAPYESIVVDGVNGFLASTQEEWVGGLGRLIDNPDLREAIACQAQQTVRQSWLLSQHGGDWSEAYQKITDRVRQPGYTHSPDKTLALFVRLARQVEEWQQSLQNQIGANRQELHDQRIRSEERERAMQSQLAERDAQLREIIRSRAWKIVKGFWELRVHLIPPESRIERLLGLKRKS
jgi:glycosyltransferase involved in cell wall biosynthesis